MMAEDALEIVNKILEPKRLNHVQETVFLNVWAGKIYRDIALESGYDQNYIKEVGSQLWNILSNALGERVTKKNVKLLLGNYLGVDGWTGGRSSHVIGIYPRVLEFPSGPVPLSSPLYVNRPPVEERAYDQVDRPGSLIRIQAPRQMGKTSLMLRILAYASGLGLHTAIVNLQQAEISTFTNLNRFLRWLCLNISRQLHLEPKLDDFWDEEIGSKVSCTAYFQDYLLTCLDSPLVLALDSVNRVFEYPDLAQDFLPLLRNWHEEAAELNIWKNLRLIIVHTTDAHVPLSVGQSPFNVGLPLQLPEFTPEQVYDLSQRHQLNILGIGAKELEGLLALVGGHPYLVRLALYWLRQEEANLEQLLQDAPTQAGIYSHHLRQYWEILQQQPDLLIGTRQVMTASSSVQLEAIAAYQLESMGLVKLHGNRAIPSRELYRLYFSSQLVQENA